MTKKLLLTVSVLLTLFYFVLQLFFITTGKYSIAFVDHFEFPVISTLFLTISTVLLVYLNRIQRLTILTLTLTLCIFNMLAAIIVRFKLDRTNLISYRQDFGIGAAYIYMDTTTNKYILERVSPMHMTVYTGKFRQDSSIIHLDKTFLRGNQETNSLDRQSLTRVE